jgi:3-methyladenine DNA glycosylase AlkD
MPNKESEYVHKPKENYNIVNGLRREMQMLKDARKAEVLQRFFKTGPGEYGQGDIFLGIAVPKLRRIAIKYANGIPLSQVKELLHSKIHEERLVALLILVQRYPGDSENIVSFYLQNISCVNNWDLVDLSAPKILGTYLLDKDRSMLYRLARSKVLWERRISVLSTLAFIQKKDFVDALKISEILLGDSHLLIHKAVGWMLREIGKRDLAVEEAFLKEHSKNMPRTTLRYAIERFSKENRYAYMRGTIHSISSS